MMDRGTVAAPLRDRGAQLFALVVSVTVFFELGLGYSNPLELDEVTALWWTHGVIPPVLYSVVATWMFGYFTASLPVGEESHWRDTALTSAGFILVATAFIAGFVSSEGLWGVPGVPWWAWTLAESVPRALIHLAVAGSMLRFFSR